MESDRLVGVILACECPGFTFKFNKQYTGDLLLWVTSYRTCVGDGIVREQVGRPWYINRYFTEAQIRNTCLMAVLAFEEHEIRETFKYKGEAIYAPDH